MTEFEKGLAEVLRPIVGEVHLPAASAAAAYVRAHLASDAVVERAGSEAKSVIYRTGPITRADYAEAIEDLRRASEQDDTAHVCCSICTDGSHTAETCHHNPLVAARQWSQATSVWACYHCTFVATTDAEAREHFGSCDQEVAKCLRERAASLQGAGEVERELRALAQQLAGSRSTERDADERNRGMTNEEIWHRQREWRAWAETDIGRLFVRFESALGRAWITDSTSNSDARMKRDWDAANKARDELVTEIKLLQARVAKTDTPPPGNG